MEILTEKYRLQWDLDTLIIRNSYDRDYTGTDPSFVVDEITGFFESGVYQDILDKITELGLT